MMVVIICWWVWEVGFILDLFFVNGWIIWVLLWGVCWFLVDVMNVFFGIFFIYIVVVKLEILDDKIFCNFFSLWI